MTASSRQCAPAPKKQTSKPFQPQKGSKTGRDRVLLAGLKQKAFAPEAYHISQLGQAFKEAAKTPQARTPTSHYGGSRSTVVNTHRCREKGSDAINHQFTTEGSLEPHFLKQCELDSSIEKTIAQAFTVDFGGYLGLGEFTVDYACFPRHGKPYAVDVKQKAVAESVEFAPLLAKRVKAFEDHGFELKIFTEDDIKKYPFYINILELYPCLDNEPRLLKRALKKLKEALTQAGGKAPLRVFNDLPPKDVKWATAYGLYTGTFRTDHTQRFGSDFVIELEA